MAEIGQCSRQYIENRCSPELRVPAMEKACLAWEICMKKDPSTIGRARLHAETFAEVINGLIDPISYKTMVSVFFAIVYLIFRFSFYWEFLEQCTYLITPSQLFVIGYRPHHQDRRPIE